MEATVNVERFARPVGAGDRVNGRHGRWMYRAVVLSVLAIALTGCATIRVDRGDPQAYFAEQRADYLSAGTFSIEARAALFTLGRDREYCQSMPSECFARLAKGREAMYGTVLAVMAELSLARALELERIEGGRHWEEALAAYLDTARLSYAYLFMGAHPPRDRALEARQIRVRDFYNFASGRVASLLFERSEETDSPVTSIDGRELSVGGWSVTVSATGLQLPIGFQGLEGIVSPTSLQIRGLQNTYRRDGLGAALVAVWERSLPRGDPLPMAEIGFTPTTVMLEFEGDRLDEVLVTRRVGMLIIDPYQQDTAWLRENEVGVSANFSAPVALWLARSGFRRQGLLGTLGRDTSFTRPFIHLMQPYDPNRLVVVLIHGLASSPEVWANVANELLGDDVLRDHFQVWHAHYPTNLPIAINHLAIRKALEWTLSDLDPTRSAQASRDMVLIGHSMGGVIARLLVLEGSEEIWAETLELAPEFERDIVLAPLQPFIELEPMASIGRAVFLAAPHAGTPFAGNWLSRTVRRLVRLPADVILAVAAVADAIADDLPESAERLRTSPTAIDQLYEGERFLQATARMNIAAGVPYHSIIGQRDLNDPVELSSDGIVPFASAYLPGADSTLVVNAGHSLQQEPEVIAEIRRILHAHLAGLKHDAGLTP